MVKSNSLFNIEKLGSRELYCNINSLRNNKSTSQIYFVKKLDSKELDWRVIYTSPQKVTTNTYLRSFQYKILNNILNLNEKLFVFGLSITLSCSFCTHLFWDCTITQCLYKKLQLELKDNNLSLTLQAAIFSLLKADWQSYLIQNYIFLISKLYIYKSRKNIFLSSTGLLEEISRIKNIAKQVASVHEKKTLHIKKVGKNWRQTTSKRW